MKNSKLLFLTLIVSAAVLSGCTTNLYESIGLVDKSDVSLETQLKYAESEDDYNSIIAQTNEIIEDPNASTADKQVAYFQKGQALMGKVGAPLSDILADLVNDEDDSETTSSEGLFKVIPKIEDLESAKEGADALNTADDLATQLGQPMKSGDQLIRALANSTVVVNWIDLKYLIEEQEGGRNSVTQRDTEASAAEVLNSLFEVDSGEPLNHYSAELDDAASKVLDLDVDQRKSITKQNWRAQKMNELNDKVKASQAYTLVGLDTAGTQTFGNTGWNDEEIDRALEAIFND